MSSFRPFFAAAAGFSGPLDPTAVMIRRFAPQFDGDQREASVGVAFDVLCDGVGGTLSSWADEGR